MDKFSSDYDARELKRTNAELVANSHQSASDRKAAKDEFVSALMHRPKQIADLCPWIANGDYGRGAQILGYALVRRGCSMLALLGMLEFKCSAKDAHEVAARHHLGHIPDLSQ